MGASRIVACYLVLAGCVPPRPPPDHPTDHAPPLRMQEEEVEIVGGDPDPSVYEFAGDVQGDAEGSDIAVTTRQARESLKAHAAEDFRATRVVIDTSNGLLKGWVGHRIVLNGRAFRKKKPSR